MELFGLACFVEVVRTGSFSRAAERMLRTQPALSLQVQKLEQELGRQLVDRSRRRAVPTEAGRAVYGRAQVLLAEAAALRDEAGAAGGEPSGRLSLASTLALIDNVLPRVLGTFHRRCPGVALSLFNLRPDMMLRALLDGTAEIGLGYLAAHHRQVEREKLFEAPFLVVEKGRGRPRARPPSARDLAGLPFLHFEKGIELRRFLETHLSRALGSGQRMQVAMELPSMSSILEYVRTGFGYSILPEFAVPVRARAGLSVTPAGGLVPPLAVELYTVRGRRLSTAARACREALRGA